MRVRENKKCQVRHLVRGVALELREEALGFTLALPLYVLRENIDADRSMFSASI